MGGEGEAVLDGESSGQVDVGSSEGPAPGDSEAKACFSEAVVPCSAEAGDRSWTVESILCKRAATSLLCGSSRPDFARSSACST